jgi:hypothetical protein
MAVTATATQRVQQVRCSHSHCLRPVWKGSVDESMNPVLARPALQDIIKLFRMNQPGSPCWPRVNATTCHHLTVHLTA